MMKLSYNNKIILRFLAILIVVEAAMNLGLLAVARLSYMLASIPWNDGDVWVTTLFTISTITALIAASVLAEE